MSLQGFSRQKILETLDKLMEQSAQTFSFTPVEEYLKEDRTSEVCFLLGISADLVKRFREEGLTVDEADKVACRLGVHATAIWHTEWSEIDPISESLYDAVEDFMRQHKKCGKCEKWVSREEFHKRAASKDGIARYCTTCMKSYERERRVRGGREALEPTATAV